MKYHGLRHNIYGKTQYDKHYRRNIEIETFISNENEEIELYCIIDDIDEWFNDGQLKHMVKTSTVGCELFYRYKDLKENR